MVRGGAGELELGGPVPKADGTDLKRRGKHLSPSSECFLGYKCSVSHFSRSYWKALNSEANVEGGRTWAKAQTRQSARSCVTSGQLLTSLYLPPQFVKSG